MGIFSIYFQKSLVFTYIINNLAGSQLQLQLQIPTVETPITIIITITQNQ